MMAPQYDEPLELLQHRRTSSVEPQDLDKFWRDTIDESRAAGWDSIVERVDAGLTLVETYDVTFAGFQGEQIRAWYRRPALISGDVPLIIHYPGYGGGRALPHQVHPWVLMGFGELTIDIRGQGASNGWVGDTPDTGTSGPAAPGFMTRGVESPENSYLRRLMADSVLAVDAARALPGVDGSQIVLSGTSQGGGLALVAAALAPSIAAVMVNAPFLCDFPRSVALASDGPYLEIAAYLASHRDRADSTFATLAYFDAALLASRATAPGYFSVALADTTCPPSGVYSAFNAYGGSKEVVVYPYNNHEGGQFHHEARQIEWLRATLDKR